MFWSSPLMTMHLLHYSHLLCFLGLIEVALGGKISVDPLQYEDLAGRTAGAPGTRTLNVTSPNDRFIGLSVDFRPYRPAAMSVVEVGLGFINAMKLEALEDCDAYLSSYRFTDSEYQDSRIRIQIDAVARAPRWQLVRCNYMYAIKLLAVDQLTRHDLYGAIFTESYLGHPIYRGVFDERGNVLALEKPSSNSSIHLSGTVAQDDKRVVNTLSLDPTNSSTTLLTIPGAKNDEYEIRFDFVGRSVNEIAIFTSVLGTLLTLAQRGSGSSIDTFSHTDAADSAWFYVMRNRGRSSHLQVFQVLAILEATARHAVNQNRYQEMKFEFLINGAIVARGCLTAPILSQSWCQGFAEGGQGALAGSLQSS